MASDPVPVAVSVTLKAGERFEVKSVASFLSPAGGAPYPAVIVHGIDHARQALSVGRPVTLLSAPGAALYAGCGWWRALVQEARTAVPTVAVADVLDCADGSGQALAALRIGQLWLVLWRTSPGWDEVAAIAAEHGGGVLEAAPVALDLASRSAERRLHDWLQIRTTPGDSRPPVS
jgi:hypothetical protein